MLAYLHRVCTALTDRDVTECRLLLANHEATRLPESVRGELRTVVDGPATGWAPLHAFRLYHKTAQLLQVEPDTRRRPRRRPRTQLELPFASGAGTYGPDVTLARAARVERIA